jgi:hypothetical protein
MKPRNLLVKEKKCEKCGKLFKNKNSSSSLIKHKLWCDKKEEFLKKYNFDKNSLELEYQNCGSVLSFKEKYPFWIAFTQYYKLFKEFDVKVSVKQASNSEQTKEKRKETNLKKYGFEHNFSKEHPSRKKWEEKIFEEEGITNVFQRESVKQKSIKTIIDRYGEEYWTHFATIRGANVISKINKQVFDILKQNKISFKIEKKIKKPAGYYYSYDIIIKNTKKLIEVNGDYWHGNPIKYKPNDIILKN